MANPAHGRARRPDPAWVQALLILATTVVLGVLVIVPVAYVFWTAFGNGAAAYAARLFGDPDTRHAVLMTLFVAPIAVAANTVFGVAAAWALARFRFPGRALLLAAIDLPMAVSPVVAGLCLILLFGRTGWFGPALESAGLKIVFSWPGLILATTFVTLPFVVRELVPALEAAGSDEEVAALSLGAGGWRMFWSITLPNVRWALLYGVILCSARAVGEFGAVYVVSGRIAGQTDTMPLRVEKLFQEYDTPGAFAVASALTLLAIVALAAKKLLERRVAAHAAAAAVPGEARP